MALKKMFKMTPNIRMKKANLNFRARLFRDILLNNASVRVPNKIIDKKIRLVIKKIEIVKKIKNTIFEIGFNLCMKECPGT